MDALATDTSQKNYSAPVYGKDGGTNTATLHTLSIRVYTRETTTTTSRVKNPELNQNTTRRVATSTISVLERNVTQHKMGTAPHPFCSSATYSPSYTCTLALCSAAKYDLTHFPLQQFFGILPRLYQCTGTIISHLRAAAPGSYIPREYLGPD